jgi:cell division protein FtsN
MIEAEYEEIDDSAHADTDELDLAGGESLPWLESDEDDDRPGGVDSAQLIGFVAILAAVALGVIALVWFVSNYNRGPVEIADGSTISAPEGPYKERPEDAGGRVFAGTGDVAPGVGQGETPDARIADATGADAGDQNLEIPMPPIGGTAAPLDDGAPAPAPGTEQQSAPRPEPRPEPAPSTANATGGVGVQLAAYSSRARAEKGWADLKRKTSALNGFDRRILEGLSDNNTVFRLQAVSGSRAEADRLCATLKSQGLDCQVKP